MGDFKEWLSDNLRYFLVGVVVILIIGGSILGLKIYSSKVNGNSDPAVIRKNTEAQTETGKETETKKQTEKETKKQTEKETKKQTEKETKKQTEKATEKQTESSTSSNAGTDSKGSTADNSQNGSNSANNASQNSDGTYSNGSQSSDGTYDNAGNDTTTDGSDYSNDTQDVTTPQTDAAQPVYMTINSACYMRSYPDFGDNIIGQFEAGSTVAFLGDEGGWYKVSVNGQVGYMGARFFN